jgi:phage tail-like protein
MQRPTTDYFIGNPPGRYLWLRVDLEGDRFSTPALRGIDARYPRQSYLEYLPSVFSADELGRDFLERLLGVFKAEWDVLEEEVETSWRFFDPRAVPEDNALIDYLAGWLGVPVPSAWDTAKKRRLLEEAARLYADDQRPDGKPGPCRRGTVEGLRDLLRVYLHNMTEQPPQRQGGYPVVIEGFRERRLFHLPPPETELPQADRLVGENERGRIILDETVLGAGRLISPGVRSCDPIDRHAHRFTVLVPAAWVRTGQDESLLRRAIEEEKPAHTDYELRLIPSQMRVGVYSTVGIDTILGSLTADPLPSGKGGPGEFGTLPEPRRGPGLLLGVGRRVGVESSIT